MGMCYKLTGLICCVVLIAGCKDPGTVKQGQAPAGLSSQGNSPGNSNASGNASADSGGEQANSDSPPRGSAAWRNSRRNLPASALAGGSTSSNANPPASNNSNPGSGNNSSGNSVASNSAGGPVAAGEDSLPNGLFPQMGEVFETDGFGGGLFPQGSSTVSTSSGDADNNSLAGNSGNSQNRQNLPPGAAGSGAGQTGASNAGSRAPRGNATNLSDEAGSPSNYMQFAEQAFQQRNENDGFKYLYAHVLTNDSAFDSYPITWFPGLVEPRLALRWGVGVVYNAPSSFSDRPPVIGAPSGSGGSSSGSDGGSAGLSDGGAPPGQGADGNTSSEYTNVETSNPEGFLLYYTGDYGNELLDLLEERRKGSPAFYGDILRDVQVKYEAIDPNASASQNSANDSPSDESLAGMFRRNRNRNLPTGNVGGGAPAGNSPPPTQADDSVGSTTSGGGSSPARPASSQSRAQRVSGSGPSAVPEGETLGTLSPGVMLLGEASKSDLIDRARKLGLDCVAIFQVRVSSGRKASCTTSLKVYNVRTEQEIGSSRSIKTEEADKAKERGRNLVRSALNTMFADEADQQLKSSPLPEGLKPEHVANRIDSVLDRNDMSPLAKVVEIVSFNRNGLIQDSAAVEALDKILGTGNGQKMLTGTVQDRKAVLNRFLPSGAP